MAVPDVVVYRNFYEDDAINQGCTFINNEPLSYAQMLLDGSMEPYLANDAK